MTLNKFFRRLKQLNRKWRITKSGEIRSGKTCPLCAVAGITGSIPTGYKIAALEMDYALKARIVAAADSPDFRLRRRMLRACGLKEKHDKPLHLRQSKP